MIKEQDACAACTALYNGNIDRLWLRRCGKGWMVHLVLVDLFGQNHYHSIYVNDDGSLCDLVPLSSLQDIEGRLHGDELQADPWHDQLAARTFYDIRYPAASQGK